MLDIFSNTLPSIDNSSNELLLKIGNDFSVALLTFNLFKFITNKTAFKFISGFIGDKSKEESVPV